MTEERLDEIKATVAEAEALQEDLEQLNNMISFLSTYSGKENNGVRLQMYGTYFPDDCMNGSGVKLKKENYSDKSCTLGTYCAQEIIKALEACKAKMTERFDKLEV